MSDFEQKRKFYRLKYPRRARPSVRISNELFHVTEVSEGGIRVVKNTFTNWYKGLAMSGTIHLHNNKQVTFEGNVLRFDQNEVIVKLRKGPSFKNMVEEQRHIRQKYPAYFSRPTTEVA
ncbi:PilZ domain-containing protein [Vibrio sp. Isolate25]|uniref:PilZ domain-containing protein n=1 Tax=Vibrio TaxID=662 RepID=UPI001EFD4742|nr:MULTISPECIES: PilZ domain-containing protein [Vibrio]MCG9599170.1 PilZ domain-containing protein [Vibrio sp. Isolate25]USD33637.1 PilZ domain-containing protein [Vibrio sp. SCSIO 43186]USD46705.1 PilZ domain-containing protein [Vibrio sp. SCSIO 43145]USD70762.1 PilZ domain-containing protein [Vibrio sp. SCSIO 43139]USD95680.1 PilZ domain-containing protein [Vibrio coralliilyticus]